MTIWLFGDSIFYGYRPKASHPVWPIRAPAPMMDVMAGRPVARLGGVTDIPDGVGTAAADLEAMVGGDIGPDDVIVMLDVGKHGYDPDKHEQQWLQLRRATAAHPGATIICEGFDNGAHGRKRLIHTRPIGARSPNDAVRAAATAPLDQRGRTLFLPTFKPLARLHRSLRDKLGLGAYVADDVHLTMWGQARLCWLILDLCGLADARAADRWADFAAGVWEELHAKTPEEARAAAALCCLPPGALCLD